MTQKYNSLQELFDDFPWKTPGKFIPLAKRFGFTNENEIKAFLKDKAPHDEKVVEPVFLPIFSKSKDSYQFDTMFLSGVNPYLVFININTRKAWIYKMKNKGANAVKLALEEFFADVKNVKSLTSDQDSAYLSDVVITYLKSKNVAYRTTEDNNHNVLGIINRFIRTLRDLNINENNVFKILDEYNNTPHKSIDNKTPNEMTENDEDDYIHKQEEITKNIIDTYKFDIGDRVRIILEKKPLQKNRSNLSTKSYIIDSKQGNDYIIRAKDGSIDKYAGYKLVKCDSRYELADTIKNAKRGIIEKIISYDERSDKYKVLWDTDEESVIPAKNLREGFPLRLSPLERVFWTRQKSNDIPVKIRKFL